MIHAIYFDLDNTLTNRAQSIAEFSNRFVHAYIDDLVDVDAAFVRKLVLETDNGGYLSPTSSHGSIKSAVAHTLLENLAWRNKPSLDDLLEYWQRVLPCSSVEMPGATDLLASLNAHGLHIGVISNGATQSRRRTLEALPCSRYVKQLVSSEACGTKKPDARIFIETARRAGYSPSQCCYVGDHPIVDIDGAASAGMTPIWLQGFHAWPANLSIECATVSSISQVEGLIL